MPTIAIANDDHRHPDLLTQRPAISNGRPPVDHHDDDRDESGHHCQSVKMTTTTTTSAGAAANSCLSIASVPSMAIRPLTVAMTNNNKLPTLGQPPTVNSTTDNSSISVVANNKTGPNINSKTPNRSSASSSPLPPPTSTKSSSSASLSVYEGSHIHFSPVDNKPLCSYSTKLCKQRRINGYAFCIRHILEDPSAPFKQCAHVAKYNRQKCSNAIPAAEDRAFCNSHMQIAGIAPKRERKEKKASGGGVNGTAANSKMVNGDLKLVNHVGNDQQSSADSTTFNDFVKPAVKTVKLNGNIKKSLDKSSSSTATATTSTSSQTADSGTNKKEPTRRKRKKKEDKKSVPKLVLARKKKRLPQDTISEDLFNYTLWSSSDDDFDNDFDSRLNKRLTVNRLKDPNQKVDKKSNYRDREEVDSDESFVLPSLEPLSRRLTDLEPNEMKNELHTQKWLLKNLIATRQRDIESEVSRTRRLIDKLKSLNGTSSPIDWLLSRNARRSNQSLRKGICCYSDDDCRCQRPSLPFTRHCLAHILYNVDQLLFARCTAKCSDTMTQCCQPTFDIVHDEALCSYHQQAPAEDKSQSPTVPDKNKKRKKSKPLALTRVSRRNKKRRKTTTTANESSSSVNESSGQDVHGQEAFETDFSEPADDSEQVDVKSEAILLPPTQSSESAIDHHLVVGQHPAAMLSRPPVLTPAVVGCPPPPHLVPTVQPHLIAQPNQPQQMIHHLPLHHLNHLNNHLQHHPISHLSSVPVTVTAMSSPAAAMMSQSSQSLSSSALSSSASMSSSASSAVASSSTPSLSSSVVAITSSPSIVDHSVVVPVPPLEPTEEALVASIVAELPNDPDFLDSDVLNKIHIPEDAFNDLFVDHQNGEGPSTEETEALEHALAMVNKDVQNLVAGINGNDLNGQSGPALQEIFGLATNWLGSLTSEQRQQLNGLIDGAIAGGVIGSGPGTNSLSPILKTACETFPMTPTPAALSTSLPTPPMMTSTTMSGGAVSRTPTADEF